MKITLGEWRAIGTVAVDAESQLVLPPPPPGPGAYRLRVLGEAPSVYVGSADNVAARFEAYRPPGPASSTARRMIDEIRDTIWNHQHVPVEICVEGWIEVGTCREPLDLADRSSRLLAAVAAADEARAAGFGRVEELGAEVDDLPAGETPAGETPAGETPA